MDEQSDYDLKVTTLNTSKIVLGIPALVITINVGGSLFQTTSTTLSLIPGSLLLAPAGQVL